MAVKSNHVTIKGIKDGLVFLLDDQCELEESARRAISWSTVIRIF